jgi:CelD/BcsL family acetyltransferase involved in cellulose biosynthesis
MPTAAINPIAHPDWDTLLGTHAQASFFQTTAWAQVLAETYGYTPLYFTRLEQGVLTGLVPLMGIRSFLTGRRGSALPFTDVCDPIARDRSEFDRLFGAVVAYAGRSGWKTIEFRGGGEFLNGPPPASEFLVHTLALDGDEEAVLRRFRPTTRRNVRKSVRGVVAVQRLTSRAAMADFYRLHCGTRRRHGLPPQPWRFFESIQRHVLSGGHGFIMLAAIAGRPVAGAVFFHHRDTVIYKFGASDPRFRHLRVNHRVMWEAIRWGCRHGIRNLDLGRTEPDDRGLLQYKNGWGARARRIAYYRYDVRRQAFASKPSPVRSSYGIFRFLPAGLLRVTGRLLYRHIG